MDGQKGESRQDPASTAVCVVFPACEASLFHSLPSSGGGSVPLYRRGNGGSVRLNDRVSTQSARAPLSFMFLGRLLEWSMETWDSGAGAGGVAARRRCPELGMLFLAVAADERSVAEPCGWCDVISVSGYHWWGEEEGAVSGGGRFTQTLGSGCHLPDVREAPKGVSSSSDRDGGEGQGLGEASQRRMEDEVGGGRQGGGERGKRLGRRSRDGDRCSQRRGRGWVGGKEEPDVVSRAGGTHLALGAQEGPDMSGWAVP